MLFEQKIIEHVRDTYLSETAKEPFNNNVYFASSCEKTFGLVKVLGFAPKFLHHPSALRNFHTVSGVHSQFWGCTRVFLLSVCQVLDLATDRFGLEAGWGGSGVRSSALHTQVFTRSPGGCVSSSVFRSSFCAGLSAKKLGSQMG